MEGSYIPLSNFNPNQSRQGSDDNVLLNPNATKATNKARCYKFTLGLFCRTIVRWSVTATIISLIVGTVCHYHKKGNFSQHQKKIFNVITTTEILCLGLNFFVSRKVHAPENT